MAAGGLLSLAAVLTFFVSIGAPLVAPHTTLELKDWLGFAGNIIGGLMTLVAAYVAWTAVQPQIKAQRDATLLDVTTREEDRLETELAAIHAFEELYETTVSERANPNMDAYWVDLSDAGISASSSATHGALRSKADRVPPHMLNSLAFRYAGLYRCVRALDDLQRELWTAQHSGVQVSGERLLEADEWRNQIDFWEGELEGVMQDFRKRGDLINRTLLPACRRRIEDGLKLVHR